jgi:cyclopropane fatty-acyl-phospholipid synthase-like methyltransferase
MNAQLGAMHAASFATDPKHLGFVLARYKFVGKMLTGYGHVLEVGCGDGTGANIVRRYVDRWEGIDIETGYDIVEAPYGDALDPWDAVYALDVLEHIAPEYEYRALFNMRQHLKPHGVCIIGMPSLESQRWASELSLRHHVNTKTEGNLHDTMKQHFHNVFMFGMNDEVLHTGFGPMCHYRLAMGVGRR